MTRDKFFIPFLTALSLFLITATTLTIVLIKEKGEEQNIVSNQINREDSQLDPTLRGLGRIPEYLNLNQEQQSHYGVFRQDYKLKMNEIQQIDNKLSYQYIELLFTNGSPDSNAIERNADSSAFVLKQRKMAAYTFMKSVLDICDSTQKGKLKRLFSNLQKKEDGKGFGRNRYRHGRPN